MGQLLLLSAGVFKAFLVPVEFRTVVERVADGIWQSPASASVAANTGTRSGRASRASRRSFTRINCCRDPPGCGKRLLLPGCSPASPAHHRPIPPGPGGVPLPLTKQRKEPSNNFKKHFCSARRLQLLPGCLHLPALEFPLQGKLFPAGTEGDVGWTEVCGVCAGAGGLCSPARLLRHPRCTRGPTEGTGSAPGIVCVLLNGKSS